MHGIALDWTQPHNLRVHRFETGLVEAARQAVLPGQESLDGLAIAINMRYKVQLEEGMQALEEHGSIARKFCGGGFGGYALYLFRTPEQPTAFVQTHGSGKDQALAIEPYSQ